MKCRMQRVCRWTGVALLWLASTAFAVGGASSSTPAQSALDSVRKWLGAGTLQQELLPPDQAYRLDVRMRDARTLVATFTPAEGNYLYRDRIHFRIEDPPDIAIDSVSLPDGEAKQDSNFGQVTVYRRPIEALIRLSRPSTAALRLHASYQGCNEPRGVCYPPIEKTLTVAMVQATPPPAPAAIAVPRGDDSETARVRGLFAYGTVPLAAAFFGFGVLLAFTPCMLPMFPILSGIIVGQGPRASRRRTLGLSLAYVLGMAVTYAATGVAAGLAGALLSASLQSAPVRVAFAAVFVLLALAMFGMVRLQLPSALQTVLGRIVQRIPGGHATSAFLMGALSALIVGPCVAPPLAGALLYIGQTRDALLGGLALFSLALGMGAPLVVVGATAGSVLRRAGALAASVQRLFGIVMLGVAVYLVSPVISLLAQQLLWAALLIGSAMFARAIDPLPPDAPPHRRLFKGIGVISLALGVATLVGALSGSQDLLRPLAGLRGAAAPAPEQATFKPVKSSAELDARLRSARGHAVMLDFSAEWCVSCQEMERHTFADARVRAALRNVLLLRADVTANDDDDQALLRRFGLYGPPGIVFFDGQGHESPYRVIGFEPPEQFLESLDRALGHNARQEVDTRSQAWR